MSTRFPEGAYPVEYLRAVEAAGGLAVRQLDAETVLAVRGTAVIGLVGEDGLRRSAEAAGSWGLADAPLNGTSERNKADH